VFHYIVEDGVTYMCMAEKEESGKRRIPFAFLTEIKDRFQAAYSRDTIAKAIAFGMNQDFSKVLSSQLTHFNSSDADNFGRLRGQIDEVKNIMVQNIGACGLPLLRLMVQCNARHAATKEFGLDDWGLQHAVLDACVLHAWWVLTMMCPPLLSPR